MKFFKFFTYMLSFFYKSNNNLYLYIDYQILNNLNINYWYLLLLII